MNLVFYGGKQAGVTTLLTLLATKHNVLYVVPEDYLVKRTAEYFKLPLIEKQLINESETVQLFKNLCVDYIICCHARKILKKEILSLGCVNLHPCLYKYKGADPLGRMINDGNRKASVASHWMIEEVDAGEMIVEEFKDVNLTTREEIYNELYPLYSFVLIETLMRIEKNKV